MKPEIFMIDVTAEEFEEYQKLFDGKDVQLYRCFCHSNKDFYFEYECKNKKIIIYK